MSTTAARAHVATSVPVRHHFWGDEVRTHALEFVQQRPPTDEPPVLLVHGVGGSAWTFAAMVELWAPTQRCLAVDMQGYGASSWSGDDYGTRVQVAHLVDVVHDLAAPVVDLVGFSWGGLVAMELAAQLGPELVRRLVVVDIAPSSAMEETAVPPIPAEHRSPAEALEVGRRLAPRADRAMLEREAHLTLTARGPASWSKTIDPHLLARWRFRSEDHWATWESLACPTLLVRSAESAVLPEQDAREMTRRLPGSSYVEIPNTGHLVPLERPDVLAAEVASFLSR